MSGTPPLTVQVTAAFHTRMCQRVYKVRFIVPIQHIRMSQVTPGHNSSGLGADPSRAPLPRNWRSTQTRSDVHRARIVDSSSSSSTSCFCSWILHRLGIHADRTSVAHRGGRAIPSFVCLRLLMTAVPPTAHLSSLDTPSAASLCATLFCPPCAA